VAAAVDAIEANPSIQMVELRDLVGMTTKRLTALFRTEIGFSPKAYAAHSPPPGGYGCSGR
jgi:methylphosphotriester-DNA--protein-cysteine methyltransferase